MCIRDSLGSVLGCVFVGDSLCINLIGVHRVIPVSYTHLLLFFLGFVIFPMGMCLVTSAFNYTMTDFSFIGLQNYVELFSDAIFGKSLVNTVIIVVASVPTVCFFSLWVASRCV